MFKCFCSRCVDLQFCLIADSLIVLFLMLVNSGQKVCFLGLKQFSCFFARCLALLGLSSIAARCFKRDLLLKRNQ